MKLKLLNGAPLREHLDFSNGTLLKVAECCAFDVGSRTGKSTQEQAACKWRDIGSIKAPLRSGWSQPYLPGCGLQGANDGHSILIPGVEEFSEFPDYDNTNLSTCYPFEEELSATDDYLQQSLIFHDTLLSSQVVQGALTQDNTVTSSSFITTSFGSTDSGFSNPSPDEGRTIVLQVPSAMTLTSLGALPNAKHLRHIYPQTPTPNLLCALMTTPERREVLVRKRGYKMELWEMTVGDDTRPSFKVTFWSPPPGVSNNDRTHQQIRLLQNLEHLHVGDVILLRNIALTSFRDIVYGQSLNVSISRARTSVDILVKGSGVTVARLSGLPASVTETVVRVKRWARSHVAADIDNTRKRNGGYTTPGKPAKRTVTRSPQDEDLPPDTMESA